MHFFLVHVNFNLFVIHVQVGMSDNNKTMKASRGILFCDNEGVLVHLFVKEHRPEDSESDLFGLRVKKPPVTSSLTTQS